MIKIVVKDKRFKHSCYEQYKVIYEINGADIDTSIPLTENAKKHWNESQKQLGLLGYADMNNLTLEDIKSIISTSKRAEAHMNIERWGRVAWYKLDKIS
jgi:hypothetical protein